MEFLQFADYSQKPENSGFIIKPVSNQNNNKRRKNTMYGQDFSAPLKQRSQANARERDRTHSHYCFSVNTAFTTLRTLIPTEPKDRKLSKIETLRLASSYISHLGTQLMAGPIDQPCLRLIKISEEDNPINPNNRQVCTFCISHKKLPILPQENYPCQNFDCQQILMEAPTESVSPILMSSDMTPLYHQQSQTLINTISLNESTNSHNV
ncbi:basic helix-loop-helix transcription factor scleraxis isoform X2 [Sitophilus oryzae]|uniref:Basic helix-loop-helix transcription factor scleraxis isoform X2 n=1 Tax=Sitophilus oryzae TaxID=7048 RepID=A0A6J2X914_SITOR|nr:basic helix-loop-helix transcription factor scleraxis isoform X2 [Sitophilus oryzae]